MDESSCANGSDHPSHLLPAVRQETSFGEKVFTLRLFPVGDNQLEGEDGLIPLVNGSPSLNSCPFIHASHFTSRLNVDIIVCHLVSRRSASRYVATTFFVWRVLLILLRSNP